MDSVLDYIVSNYVWFLVGFIVLTMMIIGYIADATDFWHKKKEKKPKDKKQENEIVNREGPTEEELEKLKDKTLGDAILPNQTNENINIPIENNSMISEVVDSEDLNVPFGDGVIKNSNTEQDYLSENLNVPFVNENLNVPLEESFKTDVSENSNAFIDDTNSEDVIFEQPVITDLEDLNVPFGDEINKEVVDTPISNAVEEIPLKYQTDISVPELNDLKSSIPEVEETPLQVQPDSAMLEDKDPDALVDSIPEISLEQHTKEISEPLEGVKEVDYVEPIVPEFITETVGKDNQSEVKNEEDIWKF